MLKVGKQRTAISTLRANDDNPREIHGARFNKLVASLQEDPQMLEARPIVVNPEGVVLGGNMRLRACKAAGFDEVPVQVVDWNEDQQRRFVIKDNVSFGRWDWDALANSWDEDQLLAWGLEVLAPPQDDEEKQEIEDTARVINDMDVAFNEHHDYVVFLFNNVNDWITVVSQLGLKRAPVSLNPKTKAMGLGRVVSGKKLIQLLDAQGDSVARSEQDD